MLTLASINGHIDITKILRWLYDYVQNIVNVTNTKPIFRWSHIYVGHIVGYKNNMTTL